MNRKTRALGVVIYLGLGLGGGLSMLTVPAAEVPTQRRSALPGAGKPLLERTLDAIMQVESGGRDHAVGDSGKALGAYQIHREYWTDGTRLLGVRWPYSDAVDRTRARAVARAYITYYTRLGRHRACPETWARIHNGGPQGTLHKSTVKYWVKVKAVLGKGK
jgi:hypothetical protein